MKCEKCHVRPKQKKKRFCKDCEDEIRDEMVRSGYLQKTEYSPRKGRGQEASENRYETKGGSLYGSYDNGVRILEGE